MRQLEFIICSALWYRDGLTYPEQPLNIDSGIVIAGRRHNNCYQTLKLLKPDANDKLIDATDMGFITSYNRFLNRAEAFTIAKAMGQIFNDFRGDNDDMNYLASEDLYSGYDEKDNPDG